MRLPLDYMYITNPFLQPGYGVFNKHAGLDLRASVGTNVYAPGAGVVTESYVGSSGIQVLSARIDGKEHRFLHLSQRLLPVGAKFSEGQVIAKTGNSGNVAAHLHWDVRKAGTAWNRSLSDYYEPRSTIINTPQGGEMATRTQVNNIYKAVLHREGDAGGLNNYTGRDANSIVSEFLVSAEYSAHQNFINTANAVIADQKATISNLGTRPTKAQLDKAVAELDASRKALAEAEAKVVEVVKEVIVEKEVLIETNPSWLEATITFIKKVLRIKE